jgi:two-component system LytT family response regulator
MNEDCLRVLIADDELVARKRLHRLLAAIPRVEIAGECTTGEEVLKRLEDEDVDVVLLDIQMPGLDGIQTKALMAEDGPYVVFTTAHPEHAIEAFDVGAADYVLKPIEPARLAKALERARKHLESTARATPGVGRLAIATSKGVRLVDPDAVTHAVFDGSLVTLHVAGEVLLTEMSLQDLLTRLPNDGRFERVHRRALVNLHRVDRLEPQPTGGYVAVIDAGARVDVSRQAARRLRRRLSLRG